MQKILKYLNAVDYLGSFSLLAYGVYTKDWLYILLGLFGFGLAKYNLAKRVQIRLEKYLVKKKAKEDHSDLLREHEKLYEEKLAQDNVPVPSDFAPKAISYGVVRIMPSRHNRLLDRGALEIKATLDSRKC